MDRKLAVALFLFPATAQAASIIKPIVACREEGDTQKVLEFLGKSDKAGLEKFSTPKLAKGDCLNLSKGMNVTVDVKHPKLFCVRPSGGLDCYWTADANVNENASAETHQGSGSGSHAGGHGRGGGGGGMGGGGMGGGSGSGMGGGGMGGGGMGGGGMGGGSMGGGSSSAQP
ncbi:MAG TPA: hypothetical protein VME69_12565 [Methylocella sp.]|nr:hypothetical protein [Methylocella sp.]